MFHSSRCSPSKLRIYNSPTNLYFLSRYLACSTASTPYCFFQDDDWLVKPIRSMYSVFKRDPEAGVVVSTDSKVSVLFGWEWCFFSLSHFTLPSYLAEFLTEKLGLLQMGQCILVLHGLEREPSPQNLTSSIFFQHYHLLRLLPHHPPPMPILVSSIVFMTIAQSLHLTHHKN